MSHRTIHRLLPVAAAFLVMALQGCAPSEHDTVLATVGPQTIRLSEFQDAYEKSNAGKDTVLATREEKEKLLDLLVKFHLKLLDAYKHGLDTTAEFRSEVSQYKGTLASTYLTEKEVVEPGVRALYKRRSEEIRASHILISLSPHPAEADSIAAYKKAAELIAELHKGAKFDSLAVANSQDPSAKQNHGDVYYFTGGEMVAPFDSAAFAMKAGEISSTPVRTQFGLHIIKVTDRRPAPGQRQCSHIMIRFTSPNPPPEDTLAAYKKIVALQDSLKAGVDFGELAKRHSEDPGSAQNGGDLGWFSRRRWVQPFDEAAFLLKPGEVSNIVRSPYGYHLIKCTGVKPPPTFEESRDDLKKLYQRTYYNLDYPRYVAGMKQEFHFVRNDSVIALFLASVDSARAHPDSPWTASIAPSLGNAAAFVIAGRPVTVDSLVGLLKDRPDIGGIHPARDLVSTAVNKLAENLLFAVKADQIQRTDPQFASLMKQYTDGLLLYQIEQEQVWNRMSGNDSTLRAFYDAHHDDYVFPDRINFTEMRLVSLGSAQRTAGELKAGKTFDDIVAEDAHRLMTASNLDLTFARKSAALSGKAKQILDAIAENMKADGGMLVEAVVHPDTTRNKVADSTLQANRQAAIAGYLESITAGARNRVISKSVPLAPARTGKARLENEKENLRVAINLTHRTSILKGKVDTLKLAASADERAKRADSLSVGGYSAPFRFGDAYVIVRLNGREPSRTKTYEEASNEVSSAYQDWDAKRLESDWMRELHSEYPVVTNKEALNDVSLTSK